MVLVTRQAPDFTAAAVLGSGEIVENFNLKKHLNGKPAVLFFWPMDFTFVCPSELIAEPSPTRRESMTLVSTAAQKGQCITRPDKRFL